MQNTRLNILLNSLFNRIINFFRNPWRKLSLITISFFLGFFMASAISTTIGQLARLDITMSLFFLFFTEGVSIIAYRQGKNNKIIGLDILNSFKVGFTYGLYLEAITLAT